MNVVILGAGRIGRGFVTQIMLLNGVNITYFDASEVMVEKLNEAGSYTIHVLGHPDLDLENKNVIAYSVNDANQLAKVWSHCDFLFTACGGKNMPSVGKSIANAFKIMVENNDVHTTNIITCENWVDPAKDLKESILEQLNPEQRNKFEENVGVGEAVILCTGTGAPDPSKVTNEMDTWIQNFRYLPMDKQAIKGNLPNWEYVEYVENFGNLLTQKLYTNNTSCGSVAYLGHLLHEKYLAEAANNPVILPILDEIYNEINQALIKGMGIDEESQLAFSKRAKAKYTDLDIVDLVTRIARDPIRKLSPNDRLIGPSRIALSVGVKPKAIALCTAAALFYDNEEDESAVKLQQIREEKE
ncbi:MAG: polysaccharide biosynthesis protein, partial [Floccifex sp.]